MANQHVLVRRATDDQESGFKKFEHEIERDVDKIAEKTGLKAWHIFAIFGVVVLVAVALVAWCAWRFFRKKRTSKDADKKAAAKEDENALVDNDEDDLKDEEGGNKPATEYLGKLQYELRYDFNTQTLVVKVI
jgi:flagellar biosynthesis/type III secretory pathway M-ring protein FliF/YscJ